MLITRLKSEETITSLCTGKVFIINCHGCKEVGFPEEEAAALQKKLAETGKVVGTLTTDYVCNPDELALRLEPDRRHLPHHRLLEEPCQRPLRRHKGRQMRGLPHNGLRLGKNYPAAQGAGTAGRSALPHAAARFQHGSGYHGRQRI